MVSYPGLYRFALAESFTSQLILGFGIGQLVAFLEEWDLLGSLFGLGTVLDPRLGVPFAGNSGIGLLSWFPSKTQLWDGLHSCPHVLIRLSNQVGVGLYTTVEQACEFASLAGKVVIPCWLWARIKKSCPLSSLVRQGHRLC